MVCDTPQATGNPGGLIPYHLAMLNPASLTPTLLAMVLLAGLAQAQPGTDHNAHRHTQIDLSTLPVVEITTDNVRIDRSCRLVVPRGTTLHDADGNGLIHIVADDIVVAMEEDSPWLTSAGWSESPDLRDGIGIRIDGRTNVTLIGLRVRGFGVGVSTENTAGLIIDGVELRDGFGRPLTLTGDASSETDRGTAIVLRDAVAPTIRNSTIRTFHRGVWARSTSSAELYDNDISYLSGDAITLVDAPDSVIARNTLDGLYAGADRESIGILLYGNSDGSLIAENAMRGLGDRVVGISIGSATSQPGDWIASGLIIGNHISGSDTAIRALGSREVTIASNTINAAAAAGIHAMGERITVGANTISGPGDDAAGAGVRIDGTGHTVRENQLSGLATGVHAGGTGSLIAKNRFEQSGIGVQAEPRASLQLGANAFEGVKQEVAAEGASVEEVAVTMEVYAPPEYDAPGHRDAIGTAPTLESFDPRIVGDFFPWDGESVQLRTIQRDGRRHVFEVYGGTHNLWSTIRSLEASVEWQEGSSPTEPVRFAVNGPTGVHPYSLRIAERDRFDRRFTGTLLRARWRLDVFEWESDPVSEQEAWRAEAEGQNSRRARTTDLQFDFGDQGPSELSISGAVIRAQMRHDRFGLIATSTLPLTPGTYEFVARIGPDDGVRLIIDGELAAETWTTPGSAGGEARSRITISEARDVEITVEYADRSGPARLDLAIDFPEGSN